MKRKVYPRMRFGRLVTIDLSGGFRDGRKRWLCQCDCGKTTVAHGYHLLSGLVKSCGCRMRSAAMENALRLNSEIKAMDPEERQRYYAHIKRKIRQTRKGQAVASKASASVLQSSARLSQPFRKNLADGIEA